ncbi:MAG: chloride channel protein [Dorea sp.]|nr:chloride channel protein [Dorea sp.]
MMNQAKAIQKQYGQLLLLTVLAAPIGALIGVICMIFGRVLLWIGDFRSAHLIFLLPFLSIAGLAIVWLYQNYGKTAGKGMGLIFQVGHGEADEIPLRLVPMIMVTTWATHLFGGSAGREGVAVQIGATVSHTIGKYVGEKLEIEDAGRIFLIAGMAAGFAGLFRTPIAAVFFACEVLVAGKMFYQALLPSFTAALISANVSGLLGLEKFSVDLQGILNGQKGIEKNLTDLSALQGSLLLKLVLLGLSFGLAGALFTWLLSTLKKQFAARMKNPLVRIGTVSMFLTVVLFLLHMGRYCGLGTNLISSSFQGNPIYSYDWILKLLLTCITLAAGFQGGEVTPLFSIGSSLGIVLAALLGMPAELAAAMGYAAVFGSATNTLLAPIMIGVEVFGFAYLPHFFIVCVIAYLLNNNTSIYGAQKLLK